MNVDDVLFAIVIFFIFVLPILAYFVFMAYDLFINCEAESMYSRRHRMVTMETEKRAIAVCRKCGRNWDINKEEAAILMMLEKSRE